MRANEPKPLRRLKPNRSLEISPEEEAEARQRWLEQHPDWRPVWEQRERQDALVAQALREEAYLDVQSVFDLVNTREPYPEAIPTLLCMLSQVSEPHIKEGIVRALTVKEARGVAARPLIEEFKKIEVPGKEQEAREQGPMVIRLWHLKWTIGNALGYVADKSVAEEIMELLRDKRHGGTRSELVHAIARLKPPGTVELLMELLDDENDLTALNAAQALGRMGVKAAREKIAQRFAERMREDSWYRQRVKRVLERLDRAE